MDALPAHVRSLDILQGPCWRVKLLRLTAEDHVLLLVFHHIVCDAWSFDLILRELETVYSVRSAGWEPGRRDLPFTYARYASRQRARLAPWRLAEGKVAWSTYLDGAPMQLDLPRDRQRAAVACWDGGQSAVEIPMEATTGLARLAAAEGGTLFTAVLAVWMGYLGSMSGQSEVLVGIPISDRVEPSSQSLVGYCLRTLPVRGTLGGSPSLRDLDPACPAKPAVRSRVR